MRAHSIGHTSTTGRSQITMPPEWMPRCRGRSSSSAGQVEHRRSGMLAWSGRDAALVAAGSGTPLQRSICLDQASCWPGEKPSALAMSRTAERAR